MSVLMKNSQKIWNKQMKIWEEALPLELQASHPNHHHLHPTVPVGVWQSLKTVLRNELLKSDQPKPSFSPLESPPSMQVSALITGVQQLEDTFRTVIGFGRLAQYFGSGRKRRNPGVEGRDFGPTWPPAATLTSQINKFKNRVSPSPLPPPLYRGY